jgi:hypothetical protein
MTRIREVSKNIRVYELARQFLPVPSDGRSISAEPPPPRFPLNIDELKILRR